MSRLRPTDSRGTRRDRISVGPWGFSTTSAATPLDSSLWRSPASSRRWNGVSRTSGRRPSELDATRLVSARSATNSVGSVWASSREIASPRSNSRVSNPASPASPAAVLTRLDGCPTGGNGEGAGVSRSSLTDASEYPAPARRLRNRDRAEVGRGGGASVTGYLFPSVDYDRVVRYDRTVA